MTESTKKPTSYLQIRWSIRRDYEEMLRIERRSFQFPWDEDDFIRTLRKRNTVCMVADDGKHILGYMVYELVGSRIQLLNFAVHAERRRERIGSALIAKLISKLAAQRRTRILCEVRESNLNALNFYKACGFKAAGLLRDQYKDTNEDAILMIYRSCELANT